MNDDQIRDVLFQFLLNQSNSITETDISLDFAILESGLIDSLGLFKLITYLDDQLGVQIQPSEITANNFATPADIIRLIKSHNRLEE